MVLVFLHSILLLYCECEFVMCVCLFGGSLCLGFRQQRRRWLVVFPLCLCFSISFCYVLCVKRLVLVVIINSTYIHFIYHLLATYIHGLHELGVCACVCSIYLVHIISFPYNPMSFSCNINGNVYGMTNDLFVCLFIYFVCPFVSFVMLCFICSFVSVASFFLFTFLMVLFV